jgi:predicted nucleic acid-binding protein
MLVLANCRGLLRCVADALQQLRDAGLWISDDVVRLLLINADERLSRE